MADGHFGYSRLPKRYNLAVDADAKAFRIFHILAQMAELTANKMVSQVKDRKYIDASLEFAKGKNVITFPHPDNTHHSIYYRLVNENPNLMEGFSASQAAHRYVGQWLQTLTGPLRIFALRFDNTNLTRCVIQICPAWNEFLSRVDPTEFTIVIVPDTDHFTENEAPLGGKYQVFTPACFDVDLRFALYEKAYLNMFVNNGPGSAATLSKKIRYLMFKLVVPGVIHCSEEVLMQLGFEPGKSPSYANKFQKWVWADRLRRDLMGGILRDEGTNCQ